MDLRNKIMERNQFTYIRKQPAPVLINEEQKFVEFTDSFNVNRVVRSVVLEDNRRLVILDDIHERWEDKPVLGKNGKIASYKREKGTFQSEIYLEKVDADRFVKLLAIE